MSSMFTRRHYNEVALAMYKARPEDVQSEKGIQWTATVLELAYMFAEDNDRFAPGRFAEACKDGNV